MCIRDRIIRLYSAFDKDLMVKINGQLVPDKSMLSQPSLPTADLFNDIFKTRGEKENEVNMLVKQWVNSYEGNARTGVVIPQLGVVSDLIFSVDGKTVAIEIMRYLSGVRGSWVIAKLRTLGALTTSMELEKYRLVDRGGVLLAHYAKREVIALAEQIVQAAIGIRESSSYFHREFPVVGLVDLTEKKLKTYDISRKKWLQRDFSLRGLSVPSITSR